MRWGDVSVVLLTVTNSLDRLTWTWHMICRLANSVRDDRVHENSTKASLLPVAAVSVYKEVQSFSMIAKETGRDTKSMVPCVDLCFSHCVQSLCFFEAIEACPPQTNGRS